MRALQETLSKLRNIAVYASKLEVQASEELKYLVRMAPKLHPQLWAKIVDIRQYRPTF